MSQPESPLSPAPSTQNARRWKRGEAVEMRGFRCTGDSEGDTAGVILRGAKDGSWVDVWWFQGGGARWSKRQPDPTRLVRAGNQGRLLVTVALSLLQLVKDGLIEEVPA